VPQHIRRDLSFYDGNSNRQFFARTINSIGLSVKAIAGQVAALFGVYDVNDNLIAGFESDGDVFVPNVISRFGEVDEFTLNDFYDDYFARSLVEISGAPVIDNAIARFDGTTGTFIQQATSNIPTISDTGIASFPEDDFVQSERIGASSYVSGVRSVVFGYSAGGTQLIVAVGYSARANQNDSIAIGAFCAVNATRGIAIGRSANIGSSNAAGIAIGYLASAAGASISMAIGNQATASGSQSLVVGGSATATGTRDTAIGNTSDATGGNSIALGYTAQATGSGSIAIGSESVASSTYGFAMGYRADTMGYAVSIAIGGLDAQNTTDRQVVFGGSSAPFEYWFGSTNGRLNIASYTKNFSFNFSAPSGTDVSHTRHLEINAPAGNGTGTGGSLLLRVAPSTTTGSTANPHVTAIEITEQSEVKLSGAIAKPITTVTADITLNASHFTVLVDTTAGDITITLPSNVNGRVYNIKKITSDTNQAIFSGTIDGGSANLATQYESITIQNETTNWWIL
jgi:hypothetical protein